MATREAVAIIDELTFEVRSRFAEAGASEERLRATQTPGNRRMAKVHDFLSAILPATQEGEPPTVIPALELGVGHGELVVPMSRLFPSLEWTAIEHPKRRYLGKSEYRQLLASARCRLVAASLTAPPLPFRAERFAVVTLSEVIEHLPAPSILPLFNEIERVLQPGGHLIVTTPNFLALTYRLLLLLGRSPFDLPIETSFAPETYGHIRLWAPAEIQALGHEAGLELSSLSFETWMLGFYRFDTWSMRVAERVLVLLDKVLGAVNPRFRDSWAMVLRKK